MPRRAWLGSFAVAACSMALASPGLSVAGSVSPCEHDTANQSQDGASRRATRRINSRPAVLPVPHHNRCPAGPPTATTTPGPTPDPGPTSSPAPVPLPSGDYYVQNADGGIFWRSGADWNAAVATPGVGFYPGTVISPSCYASGAAHVPGPVDIMWERRAGSVGQGIGSGGSTST